MNAGPWRYHSVELPSSPHAGGAPARVHVRQTGESGPALVMLHGGWGQAAYPFDAQAQALASWFRVIAPDRTGHGRSEPFLDALPGDFHRRGAEETRLLLDAMGIPRAFLWGHSDGAVMALHLALGSPERFPSVIVEAGHLWKRKPGSRKFFEQAAHAPGDLVPPKLAAALEAEHGARWRQVVRAHGEAWLRLADEAKDDKEDFYEGELRRLRARALLLHGARDPRTEPGELDALAASLPRAEVALLKESGHAPHAERLGAVECTLRVGRFLGALSGRP